jgi:uncharacterized membrane protein YoaK (UPF0700 family)
MNRFDRQDRSFAIALAAIAGYVDAIGFLKAGGFFVSFMSGNSTRLAVGAAHGTPSAVIAAGLIAAFVAGVMAGTVASGRNGTRSQRVLMAVAGLLTFAEACDVLGWETASIFLAAAAMGAENAIFVRDGDIQIGVTYMTGTLVKFGQRLTRMLQGEKGTGWLAFLTLWLGLVGGGILGASAYAWLGFAGLWPAIAALVAMSFYMPGQQRSDTAFR